MKSTHLLAMTAAALLATGSVFAGPNCKKCPKDGPADSAEEGVYEVAERDGQAREGKRERGERPDGDRDKHDRDRRDHSPLKGLDLTEDQHEQAKEIMAKAREQAQELMASIKEKKEAGEEINREEVREQMMAIRKGAMKNVYDNVLNDEQRAKVDERRKKMEERRAEREKRGEGKGERPDRPKREKDKGGDDLDL